MEAVGREFGAGGGVSRGVTGAEQSIEGLGQGSRGARELIEAEGDGVLGPCEPLWLCIWQWLH